MSPLTVLHSTFVAPEMFVSEIEPFVVSATISPLVPVMRTPSFTELTLMRPFAPSTVTSP